MSFRRTALLLTLFIPFGVFAQSEAIIEEQEVYKRIGTTDLKVYIFKPAQPVDNAPAFVFFHGGGWAGGDPKVFFEACRRFARKGFVTFSFQYRLSKTEDGKVPHPEITPVECVKDARSAMRWVRQKAEALGINEDRIIAGGHSVGGHLALSTAITDEINESTDNLIVNPAPNALVIFSGTSNTVEAWCDRMLGDKRDMIWAISPFHNIKSGLPPGLAFHGTADCVVPFWTMQHFTQRMNASGNDYTLISFEDEDHHLGPEDELHHGIWKESMMQQVDDFLTRIGLVP